MGVLEVSGVSSLGYYNVIQTLTTESSAGGAVPSKSISPACRPIERIDYKRSDIREASLGGAVSSPARRCRSRREPSACRPRRSRLTTSPPLDAIDDARSKVQTESMATRGHSERRDDKNFVAPVGGQVRERRPLREGRLVTLPDRRGHDPARGGHGACSGCSRWSNLDRAPPQRHSFLPTWANLGPGLRGSRTARWTTSNVNWPAPKAVTTSRPRS